MAWIIGTDEAGYGPNLGPLVVVVAAWEVPDELMDADLYELLEPVIERPGGEGQTERPRRGKVSSGRTPARGRPGKPSGSSRLCVGDSKQLYQSGGSLARLEAAVLTAAATLGVLPGNWRQLVSWLAARDAAVLAQLPWYSHYEGSIPVDWQLEPLTEIVPRFTDLAAKTGIRLAALQARVLETVDFNRGVAELGSKGELLSQTTLELVKWAVQRAGGHACRVHCDKHGGRSKYAGLIQQHLTDSWVHVREESQTLSRYAWDDRHEISFRVAGDCQVPSAWASMVAKYLREQAMRAWNQFWLQEVADLRPTAGYPVDARRFFAQIEPTLSRLGLDKTQVWRCR